MDLFPTFISPLKNKSNYMSDVSSKFTASKKEISNSSMSYSTFVVFLSIVYLSVSVKALLAVILLVDTVYLKSSSGIFVEKFSVQTSLNSPANSSGLKCYPKLALYY